MPMRLLAQANARSPAPMRRGAGIWAAVEMAAAGYAITHRTLGPDRRPLQGSRRVLCISCASCGALAPPFPKGLAPTLSITWPVLQVDAAMALCESPRRASPKGAR